MEIIFFAIIIILLIIIIYFTYKNGGNNSNEEYLKISNSLTNIDSNVEKNIGRLENTQKNEMAINREETSKNSKDTRIEVSNLFKNFNDSINSRMAEIANSQKNQLDTFAQQLTNLTNKNEEKLEKMRETIEVKLKSLQDDNNQKLEKMRETVDEKLHSTLEKRLGESFQQVSDRLEQVHKGLGEMQALAIGVGDLKKVLSNVKTRGILGEYQLANLLEQILSPDQFGKDVKTKMGSNSTVEYAVKLPGRDDKDQTVWLPVDSKFPAEVYQSLLEAYDMGNPQLIEEATKRLVSTVKLCAKDIRDKYLDPPNTTDFGIMFLPFEGLFAEVLRNVGLFEIMQREFRVTITGPTTLSAFLNSLQMGFRTLAIEKRSSEVWELLGAVKTEFGQFGAILDKTKKKLDEASGHIDRASTRTRVIERKLKDVQLLPKADSLRLLVDGDTLDFQAETDVDDIENTDEDNDIEI